MVTTIAHGADLEYIAEATYAAGLPVSGQLEIPSDIILGWELSVDYKKERPASIDSAVRAETIGHGKTYILTVDYLLQQCKTPTGQHLATTCLEAYALTRTNGNLQSLAVVAIAGRSVTNQVGTYQVKGCRINRETLTFNPDETITASVEFWGTDLTITGVPASQTNYSTCTAASAIGESYDTYEGCAITRSGSWTEGIGKFSLEINNNLARQPKCGSAISQGIYPGILECTGSVDIIGTSGGSTDITELLNLTETNILCSTGTIASKSLKYTITKPQWDRMPLVSKADLTHYVLVGEFKAENVSMVAYS